MRRVDRQPEGLLISSGARWLGGRQTRVPLLAAALLSSASGALAAEAGQEQRMEWPASTMETALNAGAKILCSDHFIAGRTAADIAHNTLVKTIELEGYRTLETEYFPFTMDRYGAALNAAAIDEEARSVTLSSGPYRAKAQYFGDQGCVILNPLSGRAYFEPKTVKRVKAADGLFPEAGDLLKSKRALPRGYDRSQLESAAREALKPDGHGAAFLVMHKRRLVIERYAEGFGPDTALLNWSMGKSIMATLVGRLEQQGLVSLDAPAPIPLWHADAKDPRGKITVRNLLNMTGGLSCDRVTPPWMWRSVVADHGLIYNLPINSVQHAITSPYARPAGEAWTYNNCDIQSLGYVVRDIVSRKGNYLGFPYDELYNKIGMSGMVTEVDTYGNFHLTGYDYGRGRDWIRYGLLYLNKGVWNGERLLSEKFVSTVTTPSPVWYDEKGAFRNVERGAYGAGHWINSGGRFALPKNTFYAAGFSGNYAFIVPDEDLVIVILRLTSANGNRADPNAVLKPLMAGLGIAEAP